MNKKIYIIRHCEAEGQGPDARLTNNGKAQASRLSACLSGEKVDRIVSSPFVRAVQTIEPFAAEQQLKIEIDNRLRERVLSAVSMPDWLIKLEATYQDLDLKYEGGESSSEAMQRVVETVNDLLTSGSQNSVIVAHGGIISLLLYHYDKNLGFEAWRNLTNPDVYVLEVTEHHYHLQRLWPRG